MLKGPVCIAPQWKDLKCQLIEKLEQQKGVPEATEGANILLSDRPSIIFRSSHFPNYMPVICFYSTDTKNYFASFTWRSTKGHQHKVRLWTYSIEGDTTMSEKDYNMEEDPKVLTIVHVPHWCLFVAYCDDIHFRLFSDHHQDFKLLSAVVSPHSISSMCYNPETDELVTGAIGMVIFWSFSMEEVPVLSITQELCIESGEFVHFLSVERERKVLVALCENIIRVFDYQTKAEIRTFQVIQGVSLTCCAANWHQSLLYTGDLAGDVKVWNFDTGSQANQFKAHLSAISSMVSRISVHTLMTAALDGLLKEWNQTTFELLRRVDIGEPVFQMQFITQQTLFLRTQYTFSVRTVNNFYQLFNRTKSLLKKLVRVQCGPDKARILAATEDGVIRFLSPVTGEMLFVTWPFQLLEKALDYVYDPDREELLVTMGTTDVYVLDTTKNPCPTKYILRTTDSMEDKVLCLAYSRLDLGGHTFSFIFSGYKSGKVRSVTQHLYRMGGRKLHDGNVVALSSISASGNPTYHSRESSYLCSYGSDEYIILSDVILKKNSFLDVEPLVVIPTTNCRINNLLLIPGYICVLTEQNRVRLWRQASLIPGKKNPFWKETDALHSTFITSFDYCHTLSMLVTGGADGSVRIWDILGQMLVEFDTSLKFSRVCFANQRGDLVVGCNMNIYFISCVSYLPSKHLSILSSRTVKDDVVELPLPFLPQFLLSFAIVFVPKYRQVGKQAKKYERLEPITNHKEVVLEKNVAKVMEFCGKEAIILPGPDFYGHAPQLQEKYVEFAVEYQLPQQPSFKPAVEKKPTLVELPPALPHRGLPPLADNVPILRRIPFQSGHSWPIALDGYIPNSVIRAHLFPKGTLEALQCSLKSTRWALPQRKVVRIQLSDWDTSELTEKARKKKVQRTRRTPSISEGQRRRDLLAEIVSKPWLRHKPSDTSLPHVTKAILDLMDDVPYSTYLLCTSALVQIAEAYTLPRSVQEQAFDRLIMDTNHKEVRMRLAAWEALGKMDLLTDEEVVPLAGALLDDNKRVRDLARSLLDSVAGITDKFVLKKEMQRLAETSLEDLTQTVRPPEYKFPRRVRAAGIIAETKDEAVYALTEGAEWLMNRVENQLTANLFLMTECPLPEIQQRRLPISRRKKLSDEIYDEFKEEGKPEARGGAKARWLGLFGKAKKQLRTADVSDRHHPTKKLPRIQQAQGKGVTITRIPRDISPESSSSLSPSTVSSGSGESSSSSSSGSTWREVRRAKKALKAKEKELKGLFSPFQDGQKMPKMPKLTQPILLQRKDTRTQLYSEMLKQRVKKEQSFVAPVETKPDASLAQPKPSQVTLPVLPPVTPKRSLIDPKQQYSTDRSKWRQDLYKLLVLRIAPSSDGRTATEDIMASARVALGGRAMSWEAFTALSQSLLTSQEKITPEPARWKKYLDSLFKGSYKEEWSDESRETVLAVKGREAPGTSESEMEKVASLEDLVWKVRETEEEMTAMQKKELEPVAEVSKDKAKASRRERRKTMKRREKLTEREPKVAIEPEEQEVEFLVEKQEQGVAGRRRQTAAATRKEREAAKEKEGHEPAVGKEQEAAAEKEREATKERERMSAKRKLQAPGWKSKDAILKKATELVKKKQEELAVLTEETDEEEKELAKKMEEMLAEKKNRALAETSRKVVDRVTRRALAEVKAAVEAEAWEVAQAEMKERALAEAQEAALAEARMMVLEELKKMALAEVRGKVLEEAQKLAKAEAKERLLAEIRKIAMAEVREQALAEARAIAKAEGKEGVMAAVRIKELADRRAIELAEAQAVALAKKQEIKVDEARVLELAAEAMEMAEVNAMKLAEERAMDLSEARIWELAEPKIKALSEARFREMDAARLEKQEMEEKRERERLLSEEEEAEQLWEAELQGADLRRSALEKDELLGSSLERAELRNIALHRAELRRAAQRKAELQEDLIEGSMWLSSEEEIGAMAAMWEEEQLQPSDTDLASRAQLLLDILTAPEKLDTTNSKTYQHLFQVVSLLDIPSTTDAEELAEALLKKAEEVLKEGEEKQDLTQGPMTVLAGLKEAVEAHQPWHSDPKEFASRMRKLLKTALAVLRAKALKVRLKKEVREKSWWEKMESEWKEDEDKIMSRRAWLDMKVKQAIRKWQIEQERAEEERLEKRKEMKFKKKLLHFKTLPVMLGVKEEKESRERGAEKGREEEEGKLQGKALLASEMPGKLTWSLGLGHERALKAIVKMEKQPQDLTVRPKRYRLPKDSLYMPMKPTLRKRWRKLTKGLQHHIFRTDNRWINWGKFTKLYQSLSILKEEEGGVESPAWQEKSNKLLDLYGITNPLIRAMTKQLLMSGRRHCKYLTGNVMKMSKAEADLGQRILYEMTHHLPHVRPRPPTLHGIIPLSYQNNVHPFKSQGKSRYGTLSFKWKTFSTRKLSTVRLSVHASGHSK